MNGVIEIYFPSLSTGAGPQPVGASSNGTSKSYFNSLGVGLPPVRRLTRSTAQVRVGEYLELIQKEYEVKLASPQWRALRPFRVVLRLHEDWFDHVSHARALGNHIWHSVPYSKESKENPSLCEIVVPAKKATQINNRSGIRAVPILTISDLHSQTPEEDWRVCERYASLSSEHKLLGLEFRCKRGKGEREQLRQQLKTSAKLKPDFVRLVDSEREVNLSFRPQQVSNTQVVKELALTIEAFAALEYEPVEVSPRAVVLSRHVDLQWRPFRTPSRVLGLGVGMRSQRIDLAGRFIRSTSSSLYANYRKSVLARWKQRDSIRKAERVPYLHELIERELESDGGLDYEQVRRRFGLDLEELHPGLRVVLQDAGLAREHRGNLVLTDSAKNRSAEIARNFFLGEQDIKKL
ncbi:MAG: hypothetical protein KDD70_01440 [Bdellovibrionales bacterium]|nr:hypothetical protein [Bdellovibrionales bacterium]